MEKTPLKSAYLFVTCLPMLAGYLIFLIPTSCGFFFFLSVSLSQKLNDGLII
jgi:hypothetical protein